MFELARGTRGYVSKECSLRLTRHQSNFEAISAFIVMPMNSANIDLFFGSFSFLLFLEFAMLPCECTSVMAS
ncbi:hypothetical protein AFLA_007081 [Aspergillus flavus NRRL3357]|nr:hypothetical protein AFLA_007081 [Aspergillus flavus NRRL3357]